jgi:cathepsin L
MYSIVLLALTAVTFGLTDNEYRSAFANFKTTYGKTYLESEELHRFEVFKSNLDFVNNWDEKARGFQVGINKFADLTVEEFGAIYRGTRLTKEYVEDTTPIDVSAYGIDVDWRTKGAVTAIKDQGQCGSCWAFSTTGSTEAAHFFATGKLVSLSEQNLVDCSGAEGNAGCNGGLMDSAFQYIIKNHGIDTEASYPYHATDGSCKFKPADVGATITGYTDVAQSESALLQAVAGRPVSVAIDASHQSFQLYRSGVYNEPACSSTQLDHGVLAIGYGSDGGSDFWLVKNSWGTEWGQNGYIWMSRNKNNQCGIATAASYPHA